MKAAKDLKKGSSKNELARAIVVLHKALVYYADESHWAKSPKGRFIWVGNEEPLEVARAVLGVRKPDKRAVSTNKAADVPEV